MRRGSKQHKTVHLNPIALFYFPRILIAKNHGKFTNKSNKTTKISY